MDKQIKENVADVTISNLEKKMGKGIVQLLSDFKDGDVEAISTNSFRIDKALGVGGIPKGRLVELFGYESSGKTTLALSVIASLNRQGKKALFIDMEHSLDEKWAGTIGVQKDKLYITQPTCAEDAIDIAESFVRSQMVELIVIDSVAALVPRSEVEGIMDDQSIGLQARIMSKACRKLVGPALEANCAIIFINQIRQKIGMFVGAGETTSGGNALKFFSSVRIELKKTKPLKVGTTNIGDLIRVRIVKNKVASPFKIAEVPLIYGIGFSYLDEIIEEACKQGIVYRSGSWLKWNDKPIGQGNEGAKKYFHENPEDLNAIVALVKDGMSEDAEEGF